jgi:hypothetical protein
MAESEALKFVLDLSDGEKAQILGIANYGSVVPFAKPLPVTNGLSSLGFIQNSDPGSESTQPKKVKVRLTAELAICCLIMSLVPDANIL